MAYPGGTRAREERTGGQYGSSLHTADISFGNEEKGAGTAPMQLQGRVEIRKEERPGAHKQMGGRYSRGRGGGSHSRCRKRRGQALEKSAHTETCMLKTLRGKEERQRQWEQPGGVVGLGCSEGQSGSEHSSAKGQLPGISPGHPRSWIRVPL